MKLPTSHDSLKKNFDSEICNECGKSVNAGTGLFINRVVDLSDKSTRISMGKPFPIGEYICSLCDAQIYQFDKKDEIRD